MARKKQNLIKKIPKKLLEKKTKKFDKKNWKQKNPSHKKTPSQAKTKKIKFKTKKQIWIKKTTK